MKEYFDYKEYENLLSETKNAEDEYSLDGYKNHHLFIPKKESVLFFIVLVVVLNVMLSVFMFLR